MIAARILCPRALVPGNLTRMRQVYFLFVALVCAAGPVRAQVTVDLHALDALPGAKPAEPPSAHHAAPKSPPRRVATSRPAQHPPATTAAPGTQPATATGTPGTQPGTAPAGPGQPTAAYPALPTLPSTEPPVATIAPVPPPPPPAQAVPPPAPPISDAATSAAATTGAGLRVTFGSGEADLSPSSAAAIKGLVQGAPSGDSTSFNVVAYAAGTPEDPSTARRLSLSRALAVRSALMADGVSSSRIYVRALGAPQGDATPDRVDVAVLGANAPPAAPASASTPAPQGDKSQSP